MDILEMEKILKALANRRRLAIIKYLSREKTASVYDIAEAINLSYRSTSKHLSLLKSRGVVESEYVGQENHYKLSLPLSEVVKFVLKRI